MWAISSVFSVPLVYLGEPPLRKSLREITGSSSPLAVLADRA